MRLRSLLFAPANRPELVAKLPRSGPDGVILDLEDGVPATEKDRARGQLADSVRRLRQVVPGLLVLVRVNGPASAWFEADLRAVPPEAGGLLVPKLEDRRHAERAASAAAVVIGGIETAVGVETAPELCREPLTAAYFGAEDYVADLGGVRTRDGREVLYARSRVVLAARLGGIQAIDQVVIDFNDDELFRAEAAQARALGYAGKLCIHPRQVALANETFTPSPEEVARARRLVAAYEKAVKEGIGAIDFEGQMVDAPVLTRARAVLESAGSAGGGGR